MIILRILYYFSIKRYRPFSKKKTKQQQQEKKPNQPTPQTPGIFIISGALDCTVIQTFYHIVKTGFNRGVLLEELQ